MDFLNGPARDSVEVFDIPAVKTVCVKATGWQMSKLEELFDTGFTSLATAVQPAGPAYALFTRQPSDTVDIEIGFPTSTALIAPIPAQKVTLEPGEIPAGKVASLSHVGAFDKLPQAYEELLARVEQLGMTPKLPFFEVYVTEPSPDMDPADLRTDIYTYIE